MRICVEEGDKILERFQPVNAWPVLRVMSGDGKRVLGGVRAKDAEDTEPFEKACAQAKKAEDDFKAEVAKLDLTKPEQRLAAIKKHAERRDDESAVELFRGFDAKDGSVVRAQALLAVVRALETNRKLEDAEKLAADSKAAFTSDEAKTAHRAVLLDIAKYKINKAVMIDKDKSAALKYLDELCQQFPESDEAKRKDTIKLQIENKLK